ncbi:BROMO-ADJACENT HOMOLOGY (BAH) DOMAIN-CONTAINING PROTEIN [Salix viminalis]|uniref:BROMO-ADJACENT HOMOLOGY (BAH) DOMAIN-CONTAINING PROTEIN n=1 Tax=Salix viminalis TaxID=40686 RepID=A0A9Q0QCH0_SALVM|nr:BROMO-ADJACENT HOMOLOGY (BAH) DOMAIN-CONTAINING PROTEIN [Salix viminalis]
MGNRRFAQLSTSDEEDETPPKAPSLSTKTKPVNNSERERKRKKIVLQEEEEVVVTRRRGRPRKKVREEKSEEEVEVEEVPQEDAKPAGVSTRVSGKGRGRRTHFDAFDFDGNRYELEDPVLLVPEDKEQKPYVAIIKDISQTKHGSMMVTGQWFYRPEEAERKGGGGWQSRDTRELFYSFHRDEVPAESVMHKCVVHFVPTHKQLPNRKQYPGFIVQKVYDTVERKLWKLTEKDYEYNKQHGIDLLVQKTLSRMRDLPDIEIEDAPTGPPEQEDSAKAKRTLRRKNVSPLEVTREEQTTGRPDNLKAETPGSCPSIDSEYYAILVKFDALTGDTLRDKWLERLLQSIQYMCSSPNSTYDDGKLKGSSDGVDHKKEQKSQGDASGSKENSAEVGKSFPWLDAAVPAVSALEKASHDALSSDFQKYNQKLRQLAFNLKNNAFLARRLLNRELEPSKMLNMSPNELKEGLTAEETAKKEPEESEHMQMTDARCSRCSEVKVRLRDIIQAGHGSRYQLECFACGHSWYAPRDEVSMLLIDVPSSARNVGTAPWATTKFEEVEKKLVSPRESEKATEFLKKTSEPCMPESENQRSVSKVKIEESSETQKEC